MQPFQSPRPALLSLGAHQSTYPTLPRLARLKLWEAAPTCSSFSTLSSPSFRPAHKPSTHARRTCPPASRGGRHHGAPGRPAAAAAACNCRRAGAAQRQRGCCCRRPGQAAVGKGGAGGVCGAEKGGTGPEERRGGCAAARGQACGGAKVRRARLAVQQHSWRRENSCRFSTPPHHLHSTPISPSQRVQGREGSTHVEPSRRRRTPRTQPGLAGQRRTAGHRPRQSLHQQRRQQRRQQRTCARGTAQRGQQRQQPAAACSGSCAASASGSSAARWCRAQQHRRCRPPVKRRLVATQGTPVAAGCWKPCCATCAAPPSTWSRAAAAAGRQAQQHAQQPATRPGSCGSSRAAHRATAAGRSSTSCCRCAAAAAAGGLKTRCCKQHRRLGQR